MADRVKLIKHAHRVALKPRVALKKTQLTPVVFKFAIGQEVNCKLPGKRTSFITRIVSRIPCEPGPDYYIYLDKELRIVTESCFTATNAL